MWNRRQLTAIPGFRKKLFAAFAHLLGHKPAGLTNEALQEAGLILHRETSQTVLCFILIDYSREQMHKLVTAVNGRLEPFSRGFKLVLAYDYYQLFPGSYYWNSKGGCMYSAYVSGSYLDHLMEDRREITARAEQIQVRIDEHEAETSETATR